jgi:hypothetical protein
LGLAFFGLTFDTAAETRAAIFKQIHQIVFHGKGGYDWHTVYNMPIWLRRFTFIEIQKFYQDEKESVENSSKSGSKTIVGADGKVKAPQYLNQAKRPAKYQ